MKADANAIRVMPKRFLFVMSERSLFYADFFTLIAADTGPGPT
jgi:hypothetical protein